MFTGKPNANVPCYYLFFIEFNFWCYTVSLETLQTASVVVFSSKKAKGLVNYFPTQRNLKYGRRESVSSDTYNETPLWRGCSPCTDRCLLAHDPTLLVSYRFSSCSFGNCWRWIFILASIFCWPSLLPSSLPGFQTFVMLKPLAHRAADIPFVHQAVVLYF